MKSSEDVASGPIGVVVIGRNEGERLHACLQSLSGVRPLVYVDSGSTDGSQERAAALVDEVVELDPSIAFSAGRARNAGFEAILRHEPNLSFVQMVDGDCTVDGRWLERARDDLNADPGLAVVFGRRREKFAGRNAYHRATDDEWAVPVGLVGSCGGDALFRVEPFRSVGGFNPALIAGEEPDLCLRLREHGWKIRSNGAEMTVHDIDMTRIGQWWQRARRAGFALAQVSHLHGRNADPAWSRHVHSALAWSGLIVAIPATLITGLATGSWIFPGFAGVLAVLLALQLCRLAASKRRALGGWRHGFSWAALLMAAKLAGAQGAIEYWVKRATGRTTAIMEYKHAAQP